MREWGIKKVFCVTIGNGRANNVSLTYLVRGISDWNGYTLLKGEFIHMRCSTQILNLIVVDDLKKVGASISKVRVSCKFVKSSPSRLATFRMIARECNIDSKSI